MKLKDCKSKGPSEINMDVMVRNEREINFLLEWEEIMWRQCSRQVWLRHDDKNSRFFYNKANGRGKEIMCLV